MFILDKRKLKDSDLSNAKEFVEFWSEYYGEDTTKVFDSNEVISYIDELNLQSDLTQENVRRLLRWKDPLRLTEKIGPNRKNNDKVVRVLEKLKDLNAFRNSRLDEDSFIKVSQSIFPNGFVWRIFLFHIARPFEYPIADQNVFRAFSTQRQTGTPEDWEGYKDYMKYFFEVSISTGIIAGKPKGNERDIKDVVTKLKKVDDALFAFGDFLNFYG